MVKVPDKILEIINNFLDEAAKDNVSIKQAWLFGSYAKGTNHQYSDIDLAIISDDFEGVRFYDSQKMDDAMLRTSYDIETHPYRPEDFNEENPFVREILKHAIKIL